MNPIELNLFSSRVALICDEMGLVLQRAAFSPNIKDRLDFSCALFTSSGELLAQAAHIPVHLGSMAYAMGDIIDSQRWQPGDMLVVNDPFLGGTHLPDVTLIAPVFLSEPISSEDLNQCSTSNVGRLLGFVANRAHHANIGCDTPGSMPVSATLAEEGIIISPTLLLRRGRYQHAAISLLAPILGNSGSAQETTEQILTSNSLGQAGDFAAQVGANQIGVQRLLELVQQLGVVNFERGIVALNSYAQRIAETSLACIPAGKYCFKDFLDDDGLGTTDIPLSLQMTISHAEELRIELDFTECSDQVAGNLNCPESVAAAAVYYAFRCLMPTETPACAGTFRCLQIKTRAGSIVNAQRPAAVAAGNVETSMRLVDLVFGALAQALPERIPAASQGTMNNVAMGEDGKNREGCQTSSANGRWDYYETLAGGQGASPNAPGLDACHSHMTNTLNTPVESLEMHYPLRVRQYALRRHSGGAGIHSGGVGIRREYEFLGDAQLSLLTERRTRPAWGLNQGAPGATGSNWLNGTILPAKCSIRVQAGDRLKIDTPGGGGWGSAK